MVNKKTVSNKKATSSKSNKKNIKKQKQDYSKKIDSIETYDTDTKRIVLISGIILIIFCLFYFLTVYITGRDSKKDSTEETTSSFSYTNILAGRSFSMPENEYLVIYYDFNDADIAEDLNLSISDYRNDPNNYALYSVDMGDAANQAYVSNESNVEPSGISELSIHGETLIHFKNGRVLDYIEGNEDIKEYLE